MWSCAGRGVSGNSTLCSECGKWVHKRCGGVSKGACGTLLTSEVLYSTCRYIGQGEIRDDQYWDNDGFDSGQFNS